ncbi:TNT domain-containing protein [Streptacidiphilus neutrinimicus]|uniref:TNT domain-containing protein n=1 Tax=Streptacidiphilus neutrinimicus TaxID=105420 RepID=UPI0005A6704B|nr:TNT domain-containing protein [Streptacidiphilus neutrinimicus]
MRLTRRLLGSALASLLLAVTTPVAAHADAAATGPGAESCPIAHRTAATTTAPPALEDYYRGDWRLGPASLPRAGAIGRMLRGYRPQDSTSPYWILGCYWQTSQATNQSGWWYPDNNGFVLRGGRPVEHAQRLREGQLVDLFGSGRGSFLAPVGTPYAERALPPTNLDEYSATGPVVNYHLYRVAKPFTVQAGPIRPWFGQQGLGTQYWTAYADATRTVASLKAQGFLDEIPQAQ